MMSNTLITIGSTGDMVAYLNISKEAAARRYTARQNEVVLRKLGRPLSDKEETELLAWCLDNARLFEFEDEFFTYAAGPMNWGE